MGAASPKFADLGENVHHYVAMVALATGLEIRIGQAEFVRALLKQHALSTGQEWPDDYPIPGGRRDSSKAMS
jgi:hypothetical protein